MLHVGDLSPEGAKVNSPRREPGDERSIVRQAPKGRKCQGVPSSAPSGLICGGVFAHGLTPVAIDCRPFGTAGRWDCPLSRLANSASQKRRKCRGVSSSASPILTLRNQPIPHRARKKTADERRYTQIREDRKGMGSDSLPICVHPRSSAVHSLLTASARTAPAPSRRGRISPRLVFRPRSR